MLNKNQSILLLKDRKPKLTSHSLDNKVVPSGHTVTHKAFEVLDWHLAMRDDSCALAHLEGTNDYRCGQRLSERLLESRLATLRVCLQIFISHDGVIVFRKLGTVSEQRNNLAVKVILKRNSRK